MYLLRIIPRNNTMPSQKKLRTRKELAEELQISVSTLYRYLKQENIEIPKSRLLRPKEYEKIYRLFDIRD
jgi:predicted DNA-binding transcriptional regulator AlpA